MNDSAAWIKRKQRRGGQTLKEWELVKGFPKVSRYREIIYGPWNPKGEYGKIYSAKEKGEWGNCMDYKRMIVKLLEKIDDNDIIFLNQIYTIIKCHIKKRKSR